METKKTKIICTISDINCSADFIRDLYTNGMNVVRINSAHATLEGAQMIVDNVRAVSDRIAILVDTKGPEVRLTAMEGPVGFMVAEGDNVEIRRGVDPLCSNKVLYTNCASFVDDVPVGASVLIDDGSVELLVLSKDADKMSFLRKLNYGSEKKTLTLHEKGFSTYNSDQKNFPYGAAIGAFSRGVAGLYCGRIHTAKDTILDKENVYILRDRIIAAITG